MSVLAIIPARAGSKGIPGKNFRRLGDRSLVGWACKAAREAGIDERVCSTDLDGPEQTETLRWLLRPAELAQDDTPMIAVVRHVLEQIPGPEDQIIVLLQPTQPFRTAAHVQAGIDLLRETGADSVVSVVELPKTYSPDLLLMREGGRLMPFRLCAYCIDDWEVWSWATMRRQDATTAYRRDGTCYVFWRKTVTRYDSIYGHHVQPLILPPDETCELDTLADWAEVERRWQARG